MESIFSRGGALDLHPDGTNRLQIPKGWRPRKLFEPITSFGDGNSVATLVASPDDSGFGRFRGKVSCQSRGRGGKGRGSSRKRQFDDASSTEHVDLAPYPPVDEKEEDPEDEVQYRDDVTPEEDPDDLMLYLNGIQSVDDGLWTRWENKSLPPYSSKLTPSGIASGRGDSSSEKAFSLGWGRVSRELASQAACMAALISNPPSPSAYAVALRHLYYTHDSNTAQSLLAFVNAAARRYITSLDFGPMMSSEILGDDMKNDGDSLFQPDDKRPYERVIRALNGRGGGRCRGLYLQHISFVANEVTELFKNEVIGSPSGPSTTSREGESARRQNAREYLFETFGFNHEVGEGKSTSVSARRFIVFHLLRAILLSSPTVEDFCRTYRMWILVFLNKETHAFSSVEKDETQSCHPPSPLVSTETSDSAMSLFRVLLVIIGKPACYFTGTKECDDIAEEIAKVMTFITEIILSSIGFDATPVSSETNYSNGGCVASLAKAAATGLPEKEISKADARSLGQLSCPSRSLSDAVSSLFSSSLSNLSVNKYCSRLLADLFLSADDGRRHFINVLSEIESRTIDDDNEKASCVLHRAIECQLHMFLGRSALSLDERSKLGDQMPQGVSPATLLRLIQESRSCESFPPSFNDGINSNPLQAQLDDFALWIENSCQDFNSRWRNSHVQSSGSLQSWSNLQLSPNLEQRRILIGGGTVQVDDKIKDKELRFKLHEDVIVETICDTKPLSRDTSFPSPSSSPRPSRIARLPERAILQSTSTHSNLQCLAEEMRISLRSTHCPLSQMMSHFILLLSCVTRRMSAKLKAYLNEFYGVSVNKDSIQEFNNRVLTQAITFLRPNFPLTSKMSLIRNLALTSQLFNGDENSTIRSNSSNEAAVNNIQTVGNLSLTAPSSVHLFHTLVNVQSTDYDSFDRVFEVILKDEPLPFIRAQCIYTLKARVSPVQASESMTTSTKPNEESRSLSLAFAHGLLSSSTRQRIQRRYVQLPAVDSKRYASASKKRDYIDLDRYFDEYEAFRGKTKDSMKGDGPSLPININVLQSTEKSVKFISIQTSGPSEGDSLLISRKDKEKKDEVDQKTRYEALTARREKTSNDEALQKARYENIQKVRASSTDPNAPFSLRQNPLTFLSGTSSPPSVLLSNTSALPIPPKNLSYSAECKSCTFELEYTLNDMRKWICGIPIACRVCDNLVAFCCDDEKCNKFNYVTSNLALGPTQSLVCFACKKSYGSTQVVDNRGRTTLTSNPSSSALFSATPSAAASSALSAGSSSVLRRAAPPAVNPVRIILTMPSLAFKRTETASIPGPSTVCSIASSQLFPSSVSYPLLVSETNAGRLVSLRAWTSQLLEKKEWETV